MCSLEASLSGRCAKTFFFPFLFFCLLKLFKPINWISFGGQKLDFGISRSYVLMVVKAPIFLAEGISCFATHLPLRCVYAVDWSISPAKMRAVNWTSSAVLTSLIIAQLHRICAAPQPKWTRLFLSERWKTVYFAGCKIFTASANTNNLDGHKDLPNTKCILASSLSLHFVCHFVCLWHFFFNQSNLFLQH